MPDANGHLLEGDLVVAGATLPPDVTTFGLVNLYDLETREIRYVLPDSIKSVAEKWIESRDGVLAASDYPWLVCNFTHSSWTGFSIPSRSNIRGKYIGFGPDFAVFDGPVNAIPFLRKWKAFVARSAHEFDWTMSAHSMAGLSDNERWAVEHQMYGLISAPWIVMLLLESTSPTELLGTNYLWKIYQSEVEEVLVGLCHECEDLATFARRFAQKANLELFRGALVQGKVYSSDRDVTPWGLSDTIVTQAVAAAGTTPTAEKIAQFHRQSRTEYLNALNYYDTFVGSAERPHAHDE